MNKENYCVNCKHCDRCIGEMFCCRNDKIVNRRIDMVTGQINYDVVKCQDARSFVCEGKYFEPKISMWAKFVNLFKLKK